MNPDDVRAMYTAYITRVVNFARKEYLRTLRYRSREVSLETQSEDNLPLADDLFLKEEFAFEEDRLSRTMNELPLLQRQLLQLAFIEKLPAPEIAERLGCGVNYVYKQKHLALKNFRAAKGGSGHDQ